MEHQFLGVESQLDSQLHANLQQEARILATAAATGAATGTATVAGGDGNQEMEELAMGSGSVRGGGRVEEGRIKSGSFDLSNPANPAMAAAQAMLNQGNAFGQYQYGNLAPSQVAAPQMAAPQVQGSGPGPGPVHNGPPISVGMGGGGDSHQTSNLGQHHLGNRIGTLAGGGGGGLPPGPPPPQPPHGQQGQQGQHGQHGQQHSQGGGTHPGGENGVGTEMMVVATAAGQVPAAGPQETPIQQTPMQQTIRNMPGHQITVGQEPIQLKGQNSDCNTMNRVDGPGPGPPPGAAAAAAGGGGGGGGGDDSLVAHIPPLHIQQQLVNQTSTSEPQIKDDPPVENRVDQMLRSSCTRCKKEFDQPIIIPQTTDNMLGPKPLAEPKIFKLCQHCRDLQRRRSRRWQKKTKDKSGACRRCGLEIPVDQQKFVLCPSCRENLRTRKANRAAQGKCVHCSGPLDASIITTNDKDSKSNDRVKTGNFKVCQRCRENDKIRRTNLERRGHCNRCAKSLDPSDVGKHKVCLACRTRKKRSNSGQGLGLTTATDISPIVPSNHVGLIPNEQAAAIMFNTGGFVNSAQRSIPQQYNPQLFVPVQMQPPSQSQAQPHLHSQQYLSQAYAQQQAFNQAMAQAQVQAYAQQMRQQQQ